MAHVSILYLLWLQVINGLGEDFLTLTYFSTNHKHTTYGSRKKSEDCSRLRASTRMDRKRGN